MNRFGRVDIYRSNKSSIHWSISYYFWTIFSKRSFFIFFILSFVLFLMSKNNKILPKQIVNGVLFISTPQSTVIKIANKFVEGCCNTVAYLYNIKKENKKLKEDNFYLLQQANAFNNIKQENDFLKQALNYIKTHNIINYKVIELNLINKNIFSHRINIKYGTNDGIKEGNIVIDLNGNVIGKVIDVQEDNSNIMLITDQKSRIVVRTDESKIKFIASGKEEKMLAVEYVDGEEYNFKDNEKVYISDLSDNFLNIFLVGTLVKHNDIYKIKPNIKFNKLNFGLVIMSND